MGATLKRRQLRAADDQRQPKNFHIQPKNKKQQRLMDAIRSNPITVTIGCAGTGKTYCSAMTAAQLFLSGQYSKIVLTRANVPTGRSLGHFPGTVQEKMAPWLAPLTNVLRKAFGEGHYEYLAAKSAVEIQPLETIRGQSYEDCIILVDEAQNLNFEEIKAITTRLGEGSKLVLMGDPAQSDVQDGRSLLKFANLCNKNSIGIPVIEFGVDDIVRSDIVAQLVRLFMTEK